MSDTVPLKRQLGEGVVELWVHQVDPNPVVLVTMRAYGIPQNRPLDPVKAAKLLLGAGVPEDLVQEATGLTDLPWVNPYIEDVLDGHAAGHPPTKIAKRIPMSRPWIYLVLEGRGLEPNVSKARDLTTRNRQSIVRAFEAGEPMASIARRMNVTYDQVRYAVKKGAAA